MCTSLQTAPGKSSCGGTCGSACQRLVLREAAATVKISPQERSSLPADTGGSSAPTLDAVTTFGVEGRRVMPQPNRVQGPMTRARAWVGGALLMLYLVLPWIEIGGAPAVFLDVAQRRFHLLGVTFLAHDLWLAFFLISGVGFGLYAVTALWGRIWCGWACPLTVFLDVVRRVEEWFEGDAPARRRLDAAPWTLSKTLRRAGKQVVFGIMAALLAHGFLAYFVSLPRLLEMLRESPSAHPGAFLLVIGATAALWFAFAWFREQFCIVLCPYGRLQSLLTDEHSLVIGYDAVRGEPRRGKRVQPGVARGDCVDCAKCVQACPTGIDIRQGLQLECIGCAACVDACDGVMRKLKRPAGLIRYDSIAGLAGQPRVFWRPRLALYAALMLAGITAAGFAVSTVRSAVVSVTRLPGAPYFVQGDSVRNQFLLRIFNKMPQPGVFRIELEGRRPEGLQIQGNTSEEVPGWGEAEMSLVVTVPAAWLQGQVPLQCVVRDAANEVLVRKPLKLLGPSLP
jgi:cytochrome c oxidase accessory protein FixG